METIAMKQLLEDTLKVGASLQEWALMPTPIGRLHTQVRLARPNWSSSRCMKATAWVRQNGLRAPYDYSDVEEYLDHLLRLLSTYARDKAVIREHQVADDLSLARWEERWRRARTRLDFSAASDERNALQGDRKVA